MSRNWWPWSSLGKGIAWVGKEGDILFLLYIIFILFKFCIMKLIKNRSHFKKFCSRYKRKKYNKQINKTNSKVTQETTWNPLAVKDSCMGNNLPPVASQHCVASCFAKVFPLSSFHVQVYLNQFHSAPSGHLLYSGQVGFTQTLKNPGLGCLFGTQKWIFLETSAKMKRGFGKSDVPEHQDLTSPPEVLLLVILGGAPK